jgi:hypothetical protein
VADFDDQGRLTGIDIDHASRVANLAEILTSSLPVPRPAA